MYPVPFWALLSLTAWSCTAAQDNLVLRATLSLCLLSLELQGTAHLSSTSVLAQCFLMSTEVYRVVSGSLSF